MSNVQVFRIVGAVLLLAPLFYGKDSGESRTKAVCAAISVSGRSGAVTLMPRRVNLQITDVSGHSNTLSVPLEIEADDCRAVFDARGDLLAIGVGRQFDAKRGLKILVADTQASQWVGNFNVEPQDGLQAPLSLVGFLGNLESLVVRGSREKIRAGTMTIATIVLDSSGKMLGAKPFEREIAGTPQNQREQFADSRNNRLWYLGYPHFCPIKSTTLTGEQSPGPCIDKFPGKAGTCDLPDAIGFPDNNTVLMAATRSDHDAVWRIDLGADTGEEIRVPRGHFPKGEQLDGNGVVSPDGQVFAFSRHQFSYGLFDNFTYKGSDVVVVQIRPLRVLGVIDLKGGLYQHGFAVDHRDGNTVVLVFSDGTWKRLSVEASKLSGH